MVTVARPDDLRNRNRKRVLAAVRRGGDSSRTDIGRVTGLSAATISAITSDFLEEGILIPPTRAEQAASGRGRPQVALVVNPDAAMVCAAYFQLNFVSAAMVDYSGAVICEHSVQLSKQDITGPEIKSALLDCIEHALKVSGRSISKLRRIALGFQGVTDVDGSTVLWSPICAERDIPVRQWLEDHFQVPARVANDCDMIAQALNWREPKKYGDNFGAVLLAHGVGMGLYLRNGIINGTRSSGVEFGHMTYVPGGALCRCGNKGCIEAYAGDYAISRSARGEPGHTPPLDMLESSDLESIMVAGLVGDAEAVDAIETAGAAIGTGLASLFALVDPFPIVLVGRGAIFFKQMEPSLRERLNTAPGIALDENQQQHIEIECYPEEGPLVQEGCAISALMVQDDEMAERRSQIEAAQ